MKKITSLLLLGILFLASCTKQDLPVPQQETLSNQVATTSVQSNSVVEGPYAYVFIEPKSKNVLVSNTMKTVNSAVLGFRGFNNGIAISTANRNDLLGYLNMNLWTSGQLPTIMSTPIPTVTGGTDSFALRTYTPTVGKFKKIRITKSVVNEWAWVTVVVPTQYALVGNKIGFVGVKGNKIVTSTNNTTNGVTTWTMNPIVSSYTFNYTGNKIPQGSYKVYTTFTSSHMNIPFQNFDYIELRGL
jgi:hypothetical protein